MFIRVAIKACICGVTVISICVGGQRLDTAAVAWRRGGRSARLCLLGFPAGSWNFNIEPLEQFSTHTLSQFIVRLFLTCFGKIISLFT